MSFVLDVSVAACWALADENHPAATSALERMRTGQAHVPALWWFEMRNVLLVNERRGRLNEGDTATFLRWLWALRIHIDNAPDEANILKLVRRHLLPVYDAAYLELAIREHLPLGTLDTALANAAKAERVQLIGA